MEYIAIFFCIAALFVLGLSLVAGTDDKPPCSDFSGWSVEDVPARCAQYYHLAR